MGESHYIPALWPRQPRLLCALAACTAGLFAPPAQSQIEELSSAELKLDEMQAEESCVAYRPEARYRNYGYDHWVVLQSQCETPTLCLVATDVAPEPVQVGVYPQQTLDVLTFRGSPARRFAALVICRELSDSDEI